MYLGFRNENRVIRTNNKKTHTNVRNQDFLTKNRFLSTKENVTGAHNEKLKGNI